METTLVKSLYRDSQNYEGKEILISGWVRTIRSSKAFGFIELNDGSFFKNVQIVFDEKIKNFKEIEKLPISTTLSVKGIVVLTPESKQPFEVHANEISVLGKSSSDYPLQKKRHTPEYL
ncbi:MAG TPA: asparagine--tRNA ligase, partial [Clostridiaceae bacterium]|nr:asparagine--tRNA ligase [Clostridiaceae bacterium]